MIKKNSDIIRIVYQMETSCWNLQTIYILLQMCYQNQLTCFHNVMRIQTHYFHQLLGVSLLLPLSFCIKWKEGLKHSIVDQLLYLLMITTFSMMRLLSPIIIGAPSAIIAAVGCITVWLPIRVLKMSHDQ